MEFFIPNLHKSFLMILHKLLLFLIILSSLILIEDKVVNDLSQKELVEAVEEIYEDPEKFENFNDGIYYINYITLNSINQTIIHKKIKQNSLFYFIFN